VKNVIFVAPYFAETTLRFISAVAGLPGVRVGLISEDPADRLPQGLRGRLFLHRRIERGMDASHILDAVNALSAQMGPVHRLLGALEELQVPLGQVRDHLGISGMGAEAARNFRDKARMKTVLRDAGLPCARHSLAHGADEAIAFAASQGFPLIAKPPEGSGSRATFRLDSDDDLTQCLAATSPSPTRPLLLEEFIAGEEHSFDSIALNGRLVWYSINDYLPSPLEVLREPWIQWCVVLPREVEDPRYDEIRRVAGRVLDVLGMDTGLSHMEWFRRPDGSVAISEVGARPPGAQFVHLISYAHDFDLYEAWAKTVVFGTFEPRPRPYAAGAAYLRAQGRGKVVGAVHGFEEIVKEFGPIIVEAKLPKPGQPRSGTYEGDGFIIVRHPETEVVKRALAKIVRTVRVQPAAAAKQERKKGVVE
jgi:hypothetical protein